MVKIGFDIGGVLSKYPEILRPVIKALLTSAEVEVHILTDMPMAMALSALKDNDIPVPEKHVHACSYEKHGESCKAVKAADIGLDMLMDDHPGYVASLGAPKLRLLAMPDPGLDYYAPTWKGDNPFVRSAQD
jgi:hypothetical protein